jgi:excisionase family DNA binding protein
MAEQPEWLSEQELADYLDVSLSTVIRMRREGTGPPVVMVGRRPRYLRKEVDAWIARGGSAQRTD